MGRTTSSNFIARKNAETKSPIWLIRVCIGALMEGGTETDDLFLTNWNVNVDYYRTDSDGSVHAQTYVKSSITHEGVGENRQGRIDDLTISISNISRSIQYYAENYELRGRTVKLRQVFAEHLTDQNAYVEDVYAIDSFQLNQDVATFQLTSVLDVLNVTLPRRKASRNQCSWVYKGMGCWIDNGDGTYSEPTGFQTAQIMLCEGERTGVMPWTAVAYKQFEAAPIVQTTQDKIVIDLKCSDPARMTSGGTLTFTDYRGNTATLTNLTGLGVTTGWQTFIINIADITGGLSLFWVHTVGITWTEAPSGSGAFSVYWRNAYARSVQYEHDFELYVDSEIEGVMALAANAIARFTAINCYMVSIAEDSLTIDLKCSDAARIGSGGVLTISSDGGSVNYLYKSDLSGLGITTGWQTFVLPLSGFSQNGTLDVTNINFLGWMETPTGAGTFTVYMRNAAFIPAGGNDSCNNTFIQCIQHGNTARYGGFPNIPSRKIFRAF
ncbi:MAG: hypothetical protein V2A34_06620 [Lentisphaerota bacterium]